MKQGQQLIFLSLILLSISPLLDAANIYKWTDSKGNVHYGEHPPDEKAKEVRIRGGQQEDSIDSAAPKKDTAIKDRDRIIKAMENDRLARETKRQKKKDAEQKLNKQCANARDLLRRYLSAGSLYRLDDKGNRTTLSKQARQNEITRLKENIKKRCR